MLFIKKASCIIAISTLILMMFAMPINAQSSGAPKDSVVKTAKIYGKYKNGDYILANINVKDAPFFAKGDGKTDDTKAIQDALDIMSSEGGGRVFIPSGEFVVKGILNIPNNTVVTGQSEYGKKDINETILLAYSGRGSEKGTSFISMGVSSCLKNVSVWYPDQKAEDIKPYPWTIEFANVSCTISDVTLYNSWKGVDTAAVNGSGQHIYGLYGTPLKTGLNLDINLETSDFALIKFSIDIWKNSGLSNAPNTDAKLNAIKKYTRSAIGIISGRVDEIWLYDIDIDPNDYLVGINFISNDGKGDAFLAGGTYGLVMKTYDTVIKVDNISTFGVSIGVIDDITNDSNISYKFEAPRKARTDKIVSVYQSPYNAVGDGISDDTEAFKKALNDMGKAGGGTVFVPVGAYKITQNLIVPSGVELRGIFDNVHVNMNTSVSEIRVYPSKGNKGAKAFISLEKDSGLHGLTFKYPEQSPGKIIEYPYTIKGSGSGVWVEAVTLINSYRGIDLFSKKCDNFLIDQVWGTVLTEGINIGGGSSGGRLQTIFLSYGIWMETGNLRNNPNVETMINFTKMNTKAFIFGNSSNITGWSVCTFEVSEGISFNGGEDGIPTDITMFRLGLENAYGKIGCMLNRGQNINVYGVATCSKALIKQAEKFDGTARFYGQLIWGKTRINSLIDNKKVFVYSLKDTPPDKNGYMNILSNDDVSVSASSEQFGNVGKVNEAVDLHRYTFWITDSDGKGQYILFEMPEKYTVFSWDVMSAGEILGNQRYNTKGYRLQVSDNGDKWKDVDIVSNNKMWKTSRILSNPVSGKYFRIYIDVPSNNNSPDLKARIADVKLYGLRSNESFISVIQYYFMEYLIIEILFIVFLAAIIIFFIILKKKVKKLEGAEK